MSGRQRLPPGRTLSWSEGEAQGLIGERGPNQGDTISSVQENKPSIFVRVAKVGKMCKLVFFSGLEGWTPGPGSAPALSPQNLFSNSTASNAQLVGQLQPVRGRGQGDKALGGETPTSKRIARK